MSTERVNSGLHSSRARVFLDIWWRFLPETMADVGSLDIQGQIQSLVSDKLQVVSYKWLSRNFLVSSNDAKRLLLEFVEKYGSGLEVIYTLSGWLKNNPQVYHIQLVSRLKLAEVKLEFEENFSVQVYSVQVSIPRDQAALWNAEFVQAEELFNQPPAVNNCLRDNRFCGVSNSFVKRNPKETRVGVVPQQPKNGVTGSSKSSSPNKTLPIPQPQGGKLQLASSKVQQSTVVTKDVKSESNATYVHAQASKTHMNKEKVTAFPANKKKCQNDKGFLGTGGSLDNFWGRASAKSKPSGPPTETNNVVPKPIVSAEAQISACEAVDAVSSDDEGQDINHKRASNGEASRKRRVVFDFSDEEDDCENAVNLSSSDPPKRQSNPEIKHDNKAMIAETHNVNFEEKKEEKPKVKQGKATERESSLPSREDSVVVSERKKTEISLPDKIQGCVAENDVNKNDKTINTAASSPKRRKVLKTRIDERGREVTEVVWEGEETESKNTDKSTINNNVNRPSATNKAAALGGIAPSNPAGIAGNKKTGKGGVKDPKLGNILSFFKKA